MPHATYANESLNTLQFSLNCRATELSPFGNEMAKSMFTKINTLLNSLDKELLLKEPRSNELMDIITQMEQRKEYKFFEDETLGNIRELY